MRFFCIFNFFTAYCFRTPSSSTGESLSSILFKIIAPAATEISLATWNAAKQRNARYVHRMFLPLLVRPRRAASDQRLHRDPPFVAAEKKVGETAKSAIWIPLRGVTIPRGTDVTRGDAAQRGAREYREWPPRPPRVPRHSQFSLNIVISRNVPCPYFFFPSLPPPRRFASYFCCSPG